LRISFDQNLNFGLAFNQIQSKPEELDGVNRIFPLEYKFLHPSHTLPVNTIHPAFKAPAQTEEAYEPGADIVFAKVSPNVVVRTPASYMPRFQPGSV
jgi:hypothetical protein